MPVGLSIEVMTIVVLHALWQWWIMAEVNLLLLSMHKHCNSQRSDNHIILLIATISLDIKIRRGIPRFQKPVTSAEGTAAYMWSMPPVCNCSSVAEDTIEVKSN